MLPSVYGLLANTNSLIVTVGVEDTKAAFNIPFSGTVLPLKSHPFPVKNTVLGVLGGGWRKSGISGGALRNTTLPPENRSALECDSGPGALPIAGSKGASAV